MATRPGVFALLGEDQDALAEGDIVALVDVEPGDGALVERLHGHDGLVGLDLGEGVAFLDLVADLDEPLDELAALHGGAELGHLDFDGHVGIISLSRSRVDGVSTGRQRREEPASWLSRQQHVNRRENQPASSGRARS